MFTCALKINANKLLNFFHIFLVRYSQMWLRIMGVLEKDRTVPSFRKHCCLHHQSRWPICHDSIGRHFLFNVDIFLPRYMASHPKLQHPSALIMFFIFAVFVSDTSTQRARLSDSPLQWVLSKYFAWNNLIRTVRRWHKRILSWLAQPLSTQAL